MKETEISQVFSYALEICEDFRCENILPKEYGNIDEIEFFWFTPDQLKQLIKHCFELGQSTIEK